jgi:hypothetical protein
MFIYSVSLRLNAGCTVLYSAVSPASKSTVSRKKGVPPSDIGYQQMI